MRPITIVRNALSLMLASSLILSACDIAFTPDVKPLELLTAEAVPLGDLPTQPAPQASPIPVAPTAIPVQPDFKGAEDLDCEEPMRDDPLYGYCQIPGTKQYYIWIPCVEACPESEYGGVIVKRVAESDVRDFQLLADQRADADSSQKDLMAVGVTAGIGDLIVGGLTFGLMCGFGSAFTFGLSCAAWAGGVLVVGGGVLYSVDRSIEEGDIMRSKQEAARGEFDELSPETPVPAPSNS